MSLKLEACKMTAYTATLKNTDVLVVMILLSARVGWSISYFPEIQKARTVPDYTYAAVTNIKGLEFLYTI